MDDDEDYLSDNFFNVSPSVFHGMRVFHSINPALVKSYTLSLTSMGQKYLHKQIAAWILSKNKPTLSLDRLKHVMTNK